MRHTTLLLALLAVLSVAALATVATLGRTDFLSVSVKRFSDWTFSAHTLTNVSLPFVEEVEEQVPIFTVTATVRLSPLSSNILRITPDDCIESITINDGEPWELRSEAEWWRCWPSTYLLDGSSFFTPGENTVQLTIRNKAGPYGVDIHSVYRQPAVIIMGIATWLLLGIPVYAAAVATLYRSRMVRDERVRCLGISYLSLFGVLLTVATFANIEGTVSLSDRPLVSMLAIILPATMLARCLDRLEKRPMPLLRSNLWAIFSIACFVVASVPLAEDANSPWAKLSAGLGLMGSVLTMTPASSLLARARRAPCAVMATLLAALAPHAYWALNLPAWGWMAEVTGAMVRGLLWVVGLATTTSPGDKKGEGGQIVDYYVYVTSPDFSVQIGSWCSGFEGVALFTFLLSLFVLLDWPLFSKVRHLWAIYLLTVPFVLAVNALRIAGLFIYAVWNVREYGRTQAIWATIEAFHSNIGWVIYSLAFALFLPLVYRWARLAAKVR